MLAEARTVDEVKEVRDKAEVARLYARERDLGLEAQNYAAEIKIRAERKLGELIPVTIEGRGGDQRAETKSQRTTLKDLGIDKAESHRFQQVAAVPEAAHITTTPPGVKCGVIRRRGQMPLDLMKQFATATPN